MSEIEQLRQENATLLAQVEQLKGENKLLISALCKYGNHLSFCPACNPTTDEPNKCICGYDEAIRAAMKQSNEK